MATDDLSGRVVLVTGATDGLGRALAGELAARGATVLLHGRDAGRLAETEEEIRARTPGAGLRSYRADLASLAEVHALATEVREAEAALHVLVNNAGIGTDVPGGPERQESADGHELRFAVNFLAGYALTDGLLGLLRASAPARVVYVASAGQAPIDWGDVMLERSYSGVQAYCQSKLAQIMEATERAGELDPREVSATALHPATYMPTKIVPSPVSSIAEGMEATLRLVADPALEGVSGVYFHGRREAAPHAQAQDPAARRRLRELADRLTAAP